MNIRKGLKPNMEEPSLYISDFPRSFYKDGITCFIHPNKNVFIFNNLKTIPHSIHTFELNNTTVWIISKNFNPSSN